MSYITEVVVFRLNDEADEQQFLTDAQATFELLKDWDGYIDRELSVSDDGIWVDRVTWVDMVTAQQAAEQIMQSVIGQQFGRHIAPDSIQMMHVIPKLNSST